MIEEKKRLYVRYNLKSKMLANYKILCEKNEYNINENVEQDMW